jgi:hypothetical protein
LSSGIETIEGQDGLTIELSLMRSIKASKEFVFDWWTDLSPDDTNLVKPLKKRKIISKEPNFIVVEDEEEMYFRKMKFLVKVSLERPDRWISEYDGKVATARSEYTLQENADGNTTTLFYHTKIEPKGFLTKLFSPLIAPFIKRIFASEMKIFIGKLEDDYLKTSELIHSS